MSMGVGNLLAQVNPAPPFPFMTPTDQTPFGVWSHPTRISPHPVEGFRPCFVQDPTLVDGSSYRGPVVLFSTYMV